MSESLQLLLQRRERSAIASVGGSVISGLDDGENRFKNEGRVFQDEFVLVEKLLAFQ